MEDGRWKMEDGRWKVKVKVKVKVKGLSNRKSRVAWQ